MENEDAKSSRVLIELEGSVRKYSRFNLLHNLRRKWLTRKIGFLGTDVYIEPKVRFLRHPENISIGSKVIIKEGATICPANKDARITMGDWSTIGYHTFVFSSLSISIGKNCLIGPFCYLVDSNHGVKRDHLIRTQKMIATPIVIGDDVYLGVGVMVLPGVNIGYGAVIGAGSVLPSHSKIPPYAIAVGNPARIIAYRE